MLKKVRALGMTLGLLLIPVTASAHAFAEPVVLPVPLPLYLIGSSFAIIASFLFLCYFTTADRDGLGRDSIESHPRFMRFAAHALRYLAVFLLILTICTGISGRDDYAANPAPALFWLGLMLAMAYLSMIVDGVWSVSNPFLYSARLFVGDERRSFEYPEWLGCIPALIFYYGLISLELFSNGAGGSPRVIAWLLISYLLISIAGSRIFGIKAWFSHGDFFTLFFGTMGKFASIRITEDSITFYKLFARLSDERPENTSQLLFILLILAATAFDGFSSTQTWSDIVFSTPATTSLAPVLGYALFALSLPLFLTLYAAAIGIMKRIAGAAYSFNYLLLRFAYSLVPIAAGYNIAHYFTWFISQGLSLVSLLSDPFALGWDLFGTKAWVTSATPLNADLVWNIQVLIIVGAHIIATYVAHTIALREFKSKRLALSSQIPMIALMVVYTCFGLWILSQPVGSLS